MAQVFSRKPVTAETRVRSQSMGDVLWTSSTGTGSCLSSSFFPCQCNPTSYSIVLASERCTRWRSWLRRDIACSISDGVIGIFHWHSPFGRTQPLTEMSTRGIIWGLKAFGACGWQSCHLHVPIVLQSESLNLLESSGPFQVCAGFALPCTSIEGQTGEALAFRA